MTHAVIDVGIAQCAMPGEVESGDRCVVKLSDKRAMVAVIDGVGHGAEAARVAQSAVEVLESFDHEPVSMLMMRCHERLQGTRGAAITLTSFDPAAGMLEWVGAGNVAAALFHAEPSGTLHCRELLVRGGIAGALLPSIAPLNVGITGGDIVIMATDGVSPGFSNGISHSEPPQPLAERLLAQYQTTHDDAMVVVACVQGNSLE